MLRNLKIWQKLVMIALAFSLPIAVLLFLVIKEINYNIRFNQWEKYGNEYQRPLEKLLEHISQHKLLAQRYLSGDERLKPDLSSKQAQIEEDFQILDRVNRKLGIALQITDEGLAKRKREHYRPTTMYREWLDLKTQLANLTPGTSHDLHTHLIGDLRTLITHVGDTSNLILDPDLDSYYLMDVTLLALPQTQDRVQEVFTYGEGALHRQAMTSEERQQLSVYAALLKQSDLGRINSSAQTSLNEDPNFLGVSPSLQRNLPPAMQENSAAMEAFINLTQHIANSESVDVPPEQYIAANTKALEASFKLWNVAVQELDTLLQARIDNYKESRVLDLGLTVAAVAASAVLVFFIIRGITRPLSQAVMLARQVSSGDLTMTIAEPSKDETGQLLVAMQSTTGKLSEIITAVRSVADSLSTASVQVLSTAQSLSQGTSDQAASMQESTVSLEQMSVSITRNAEVSRQTEQMGLQGAQDAEACEQSVRETVAAMKAIAQKTAIIEDITNQTNLLAVNSAIEAARAGEQGKGFAVLAMEVRKLAERTKTAAQEISDLVSSSAQVAEHSSRRLVALVPSIHKTVQLFQEVAAASNEQSVGVAQINGAMSQVDQVMQHHASAARELAAMAEVVASNAEALQKLIAFFRVAAEVGGEKSGRGEHHDRR